MVRNQSSHYLESRGGGATALQPTWQYSHGAGIHQGRDGGELMQDGQHNFNSIQNVKMIRNASDAKYHSSNENKHNTGGASGGGLSAKMRTSANF